MGLQKQLGFVDLFALATGTMISSGFFLLPGIAFAETAPSVILAFFAAGLLTIPALFSQSELCTAMPKSGGTYYFLDRSMGPLAGTIGGLGTWLSMIFKAGFGLIGFSIYFVEGFGLPLSKKLTLVTLCLLLTGLNIAGSKKSGRFQLYLVVGVLTLLTVFALAGGPQVKPRQFSPFLTNGWGSLLATMGMVFISYAGLTKIASVGEEATHPDRDIPRAMIASLVTVMIVYSLGIAVVVGVLPASKIAGNTVAIPDAARVVLGSVGYYVVISAALLAFVSCANAGLMSASRYPFAMARDNIFPQTFEHIHKGTHTPLRSIVLTSAIVIALILFFDVKGIAKLASAFQFLLFAFINIAVIVMRESDLKGYRPGFRSPLYPWMQIAGVITSLAAISLLGKVQILFSLALVVAGALWYWLYVKSRTERKGAVNRLMDKLLGREIREIPLLTELRQIQKDKGLRPEDPFEALIHRASFVEAEEGEDFSTLVLRVSQEIEELTELDHEEVMGGFLAQNLLGKTPCEDGVALPHLHLHDVEEPLLVMARAKEGLVIEEGEEPIVAFFFMLGLPEDPGLHLRLMAALAVAAEQPGFLEDWKAAASTTELKELFVPSDEETATAGEPVLLPA